MMMNRKKISPIEMAISISEAYGKNFPINVTEVAYEISKHQPDPIIKIGCHDALHSENIVGFLDRSKKKPGWLIGYSPKISEVGRIRFTIAHELGHYMCHRHNSHLYNDSETDLRDFPFDDSNCVNIEQEANLFASFLLMPIKDFREQVDERDVTVDLVSHCAERYQTSLTAAALKLITFTRLPVCLIISEGNRVLWARSSKLAYKLGYFFKKGFLLPQATSTTDSPEGTICDGAPWDSSGAIIKCPISP